MSMLSACNAVPAVSELLVAVLGWSSMKKKKKTQQPTKKYQQLCSNVRPIFFQTSLKGIEVKIKL